MAVYTIQIWNQSKISRNYLVFMGTPDVVGHEGDPQVYTNVWASFPALRDGGFDSITYEDFTYAYWSNGPQDTSTAGHALSGGVVQVNTATQDTVPFEVTDTVGFGEVSHGGALAGSFAISSGADFTPAHNYLFGLARPGQTPIPTPVATVKAMPNEVVNFTPIEQFYVAEGAFPPGTVLDTTTLTAFAEIDFTGKPQTTATVIQAADGSYSVSYS